jgi:L-serine dehydratase
MEHGITTFRQLYYACKEQNRQIYEIALDWEVSQGEYSEYQVRLQAKKSLDAMREAIKTGLSSTEPSPSGMSGDDCDKLQKTSAQPILGETAKKVMTYALATSEQNLRMGTIVACPTAGSCGIVPAVLIAFAEDYKIKEDDQINALITAGEVGRLVANKMALAGAVGGCQAECGVASAMATAALTQMRNGNIKQIINAVALALKNVMGLTCDPVCGLVEIPCVKRNPFLAIHAITASELAMANITSKIPTDEVVDAMEQTGQLMSPLLKESSQGGLAKTKTAIALEKNILK